MALCSLRTVQEAIRAGWCLWTSDPIDQARWSPSNPAWGQCASTALGVQDLLGGRLLMSDVHAGDGRAAGAHYWNRVASGLEVDLTRDQFRDGEAIGPPRDISRPADVTRGRLPGQYHLLSARVTCALAGAAAAQMSSSVSVKAVCVQSDGRALLCRNHRGGWELPGGRPRIGELFQDCVTREVAEETGLHVTVDQTLGSCPFEVIPGTWVDVVAYKCAPATTPAHDTIHPSHEHTAVTFIAPDSLSDDELPIVYKHLLAAR